MPPAKPRRPRSTASAVTIVIGPEGGLEDQERAALRDAGFRPLALAAHTLRFETAALAAAAAVDDRQTQGDPWLTACSASWWRARSPPGS